MNIDNIAHIISLIFGLFVIFCFAQGYFYGAKKSQVFTDQIDLGYIRVKPEQPTVIYKEPKSTDIKKECLKILVAIGYSTTVAQQIIRDFFKENTANSVEEFFVKLNKS